MKPYFKTELGKLYHGDCLYILPEISGVTACVTDPPYGLNFMGKHWDHGVPGIQYWEMIMTSCLPGAPLFAFGGTRTVHRLVCAIEDAGWEIRDGIEYFHWIYGSGFPKSHDVSKGIDKAAGAERDVVGSRVADDIRGGNMHASNRGIRHTIDITAPATEAAKLWEGYGTALKPAHEPICFAIKPIEGTFANNALKYGVAGINVDGGRVGTDENLNGGAYSGETGNRSASSYEIGQSGGQFKQPKGRWPANVIHDGSPEVVGLFPEQKSGAMKKPYTYTNTGNSLGKPTGETKQIHDSNEGSAARFFYCAKSSRAERGEGCTHPTVKPLSLIKYLITLVTMPERNLILDPFVGSGTTAMACEHFGLPWVACEKDESSCEIAAKRIEAETKQRKLF